MDRFVYNKPGTWRDGVLVNPQMKHLKTQLCVRFKLGSCGYGSHCQFAHGVDDLRGGHGARSFPARVEDGGGSLCRVFYNRGQCGYVNCRFRHVTPGSGSRGTSGVAVSARTRGSFEGGVIGVGNRMVAYKKTKLCKRWEISGSCKFGNQCTYAHGLAELRMPVAQIPLGARDASTDAGMIVPLQKHGIQRGEKLDLQDGLRTFNKLQGRIEGIYADWIEDAQIGVAH